MRLTLNKGVERAKAEAAVERVQGAERGAQGARRLAKALASQAAGERRMTTWRLEPLPCGA